MEIIDVHTHVGRDSFLAGNSKPTISNRMEQKPEELMKIINKHEIYKAVVMPFPMPCAYLGQDTFWYNQEHSEILSLREEKFLLFPAINPKDEKSIIASFNLVKTSGLKGLKFHPLPTRASYKELDGRISSMAADQDIPILIHIGTGKENFLVRQGIYVDLPEAIKLAEKNHKTKYIFAHMGRLDASLEQALSMENIYFDTSGISLFQIKPELFLSRKPHQLLKGLTGPQIIEYLVERGYGPKLLWGSDMPCCSSYDTEMECVVKANITNALKEDIFSNNARKLLKLTRSFRN